MKNETVADRIRLRIEALGTNPSAVALEAGLSRSSVLDILKGKAANPRLDTLKKLTVPLKCSLRYLTGDADVPDPHPGRLSDEEHVLLDHDITDRAIELAVGVFRERGAVERKIPLAMLVRDPNNPGVAAAVAIAGDDSLSGIGILKGDQLTYLTDHYSTVDFPLADGSIAIVRRDLGNEASEYSARQVEIVGGQVYLTTRPSSEEPKRIKIWQHEIGDDTSDGFWQPLRNNYLIEPHKAISIEGLVIRVIRVLPNPM